LTIRRSAIGRTNLANRGRRNIGRDDIKAYTYTFRLREREDQPQPSLLPHIYSILLEHEGNSTMANGWSIFIGLAIVVALSVIAWFFSPKGENQTVWRSTLILSFASCYLMWAITFLAQYHPLIKPRMSTLNNKADWSGAD